MRWVPAAVWMALIFAGSGGGLSATHTSRFIEPLLRWLSAGHLTVEQIDLIHFLIRKAGHVSEYAVLCLLFRYALAVSDTTRHTKSLLSLLLPVLLATGYAAADEFHQSFVPGRSASVYDVLIDATGALLALGLWEIWRTVHKGYVVRRPDVTR